MSRISVDVSSARIPVLQVGYQGENEVTDVLFDISSWIAEFGEGVAQLRVKRPGNSEEESYVLSLTITDGIALWTVSETDTFNKGNGKVQLSYLVGNIVKKAVIYPYKVGKSIVGADNPVDPFDSWIERSKAWAIGETLYGDAVPETDETYQNNAKYYAEQADILGSAQVVLATEKATLATEKAGAAAESEANAAASEAAVNGVSTQLTTRMAAIETEQSVQSARMDTFTSLPEGSTSGNAELADIRVGADGTTYDTAGNAVRGQISELKSDLGDIEKDFNKFLVPNNRNLLNPIYVKSDKYLNDDGIAIDNSYGWGVSGFVEVESGKKYSTNFQLTQCFYYDSNKNKIAKVNGTEITFNEKYTTDIVPINAKYIRFSMYPSNPHYLNGTMMMIEGSGTVAYVPFERTLKTVNDEKDEIESIIGNRKVLNWEDGKLLVNGVVGTSDAFALAMVDVYPNEKIIVKTGLDGTATVTLFDSDGGIIKNYTSSDGESADGSNIIRKLTISAPSNAKTIGVSCFKNALSTSDAYVGSFDIYNTVMNKQSQTEDLYYFACGDSITHANHSGISTISDDDKYCPIGGSEGFTDYKKKGYPYYIAKKNNLKWFNYGIGGSTLTDISVNGTKYHPFSEENGRYTKLDSSVTPNYISIFFGWNDGYWGRYAQAEKWLKDTYGSQIYYPLSTSLIGTTHSDGTPYATQTQYDACNSYTETIEDKSYTGLKLFSIKHIGNINSYDITTWYGAWNTVLEYMIKKYPYAKIMPIVPYTPEWYGAEVVTKELREAVRLVSTKWGLAYFDFNSTEHQLLFNTATQFTDNEYLAKYRVDNLLADGLHPNARGYKYIANMIGSKLMSI